MLGNDERTLAHYRKTQLIKEGDKILAHRNPTEKPRFDCKYLDSNTEIIPECSEEQEESKMASSDMPSTGHFG